MAQIKIMVNGMPGNVAVIVARHALEDERFELIDASLTGPEIEEKSYSLDQKSIRLIHPEEKDGQIGELKRIHGPFICVDFTHPTAVNENADFYCRNGLPFVMGTTGGDRKKLEDIVLKSDICAVIAPNMAKQIVGFQEMMAHAAETFPGLFNGYSIQVKESHQNGKVDTSGTAKAMIRYFNQLGTPCEENDIVKVRDPKVQKDELGVPEEFLTGHGWHTYTLMSNNGTVKFEFTHNVNGRDVYAEGTFDALLWLNEKIGQNTAGRVFSMIDVLKGNNI